VGQWKIPAATVANWNEGVTLVDGSMCYFTGVSQGDELQGAYFCMTWRRR
jgi:hypothetical protein